GRPAAVTGRAGSCVPRRPVGCSRPPPRVSPYAHRVTDELRREARRVKLTPAQRDQIAADAAARYRAGESWQQIAQSHGVTGEHVRRLTIVRHDITYRRWGRRPV